MEGQGSTPNPRAAPSLAAVPGASATVPGGSRDCFSLLPDHLLVCILLRLRTKDAVKTSALSQRWRRVWAQLPALNFDGVESSVPASTLAAYKAHGEGDIHKLIVSPSQVNAEDTTDCLSRAAHLVSGRLFFDNRRTVTPERLQLFLAQDEGAVVPRDAVELACFEKATEIWLDVGFLGLRLPPTGVFDALRVLWLGHFWCRSQFSISDTMLPSLQALTIRRVRGLVVLTLNSKSLLYIRLSVLPESQQLNILAPVLYKLEATSCFYVLGSVASIAAKRLEILRWEGPCVPEPVCLREMPHLRVLGPPPITTLWSEDICAEFLNCFPAVDHLELDISLGQWMNGSPLLMEDITIPYVNVLWLYLETNGHVFEGRVLQLLTKSPGIRVLNLSFQVRDEVYDFCLRGCICHNEPGIWRANVVPMRTLEIVNVANFHGAPREVYLVKQVVLRAPRLKLLRIISKVQDHSLDGIGGICPAGCVLDIVVVPG